MTAAIYCRLSREDEEKQSESESIQNQKSMLIKYALDKGWDIYNIYCDEDYSGIDRERPAFRQLIADAEARRFDIVLVKTQSRFTRDMELVEKYIHGLFAEWGIRFVATVDNVDTDIKGNKKARQINGLVNEWYLEDLSENIRTVFDYKRRAGQYIGGFPLYGYRKDPADKNKLIVEPQAAAVVRRIYALYLAGHGTQSIAAILNRDGVPNPTRHKQAMGYPYRNGAAHNDHGLWNRTTVSRILRDQMYTGDLVQGRTKKISYKSKKMASVPQRDWIIVPDSHEPVISRRTFERVQEMLHARTRSTGLGEVHPLAGKVHCMQCGSAMQRYSNGRAAGKYSYLRCKLYATHKPLCTNHNIRLDWLEEEVLRRLQCHINRYFDPQQADAPALIAVRIHQFLGHRIRRGPVDFQRQTDPLHSHGLSCCEQDALHSGLNFFQVHMRSPSPGLSMRPWKTPALLRPLRCMLRYSPHRSPPSEFAWPCTIPARR